LPAPSSEGKVSVVSLTVTPIKPEIGVEIAGMSGSEFVDPAVAEEAQALLDAHGMVVYRDANIDDDDLIAFSHLLGPVHIWPSNDPDRRELGIVSLDPEVSKNAAVQRGTFKWHIDGTMADHPHRITRATIDGDEAVT
jgi:alpha-ketoglutarate-dependent taurine dioxygenase